MNWGIGRGGDYRFIRVDFTTREELEELTTVLPGGTLTRNIDTELKENGRVPCVEPPDLGDDLLRIYYDVEDEEGAEESVVLGTLHAVRSTAEYTEATERADLVLYSALLTLQQAVLLESLTIPAETVAVDYAKTLCEDYGVPVWASPSTKELTQDASFKAGDSVLGVINYLMDFAGFWSARPDPTGRVALLEYTPPGERTPVYTFEQGESAMFVPQATREADAFNVPNVAVLTAALVDSVISASYVNSDPNSPYSTVNRNGRQIAVVEQVADAIDEADLLLRAEKKLSEATSRIETTNIQHAFVPVTIGDVVRFAWPERGMDLRASIQSQTLALDGPSCLTDTVLKRALWT